MTSFFIMTVCWYISGLFLQHSAKQSNIDEFKNSGSPRFIYYGLREYRFLKNFIFSGRFLLKDIPKYLRTTSIVYVVLSILEILITISTMLLLTRGEIN